MIETRIDPNEVDGREGTEVTAVIYIVTGMSDDKDINQLSVQKYWNKRAHVVVDICGHRIIVNADKLRRAITNAVNCVW